MSRIRRFAESLLTGDNPCMRILIFFCFLLCSQFSFGQRDSSLYNINLPIEGAITVAGFATTTLLFDRLFYVATMRDNDVLALNWDNINRFDRPVAKFNPENFENSQKFSDLSMNVATALPFFLLIDRKIRRDWAEYLVLYLETQMINTALYQTAAFSVRRPRPLTYNQSLPPIERTGQQRSNSFYSGHVSTAATASFLMAKVYTDYHQITGWPKVALFTAALIPPATVGYYRMHAGKHFRTDVLVGMVVGALTGIGIPEIHRILNERRNNKDKPPISY